MKNKCSSMLYASWYKIMHHDMRLEEKEKNDGERLEEREELEEQDG